MLENNIPEHHLVLENSLNFSPKDAVVETTFLHFYFNFILIDFPEHLHESLKDKIPLMLFCLLKVAASLSELKDEGKWLSIGLLL